MIFGMKDEHWGERRTKNSWKRGVEKEGLQGWGGTDTEIHLK